MSKGVGDKEEGKKGGKLEREGGDDNSADTASANFWLAEL